MALFIFCLSLIGTQSFDHSYRARYRGNSAASHLRRAAEESSTSSSKTEEEVREKFKTSIEVPSSDQEQTRGAESSKEKVVLTESYLDSAAFESLKVKR